MVTCQREAAQASQTVEGCVIVKFIGAGCIASARGDDHVGSAVLGEGADIDQVAGGTDVKDRGVDAGGDQLVGDVERASGVGQPGGKRGAGVHIKLGAGQGAGAAERAAVQVENAVEGIAVVVEEQDTGAFLAEYIGGSG